MEMRLIFRVPPQYKHLRSTQRVTCLLKNPEKFQRYIKKKRNSATTWKQEQ
jgi:hypothetical protein